MNWLDEGIINILNIFEYEFYIVQQVFEVNCVCVGYGTKQASPTCEKCLGTGKKIKIKKIKGASEDKKSTFQNINVRETSTSVVYYINSKYPLKEENLIVDEDDVYHIYRVDRKKTTNKKYIYNKCLGVEKKTDKDIFLQNFKNIIYGGQNAAL